VACINNTGPGLGQVGPATTYAVLTDFQTSVCSFAMLLGPAGTVHPAGGADPGVLAQMKAFTARAGPPMPYCSILHVLGMIIGVFGLSMLLPLVVSELADDGAQDAYDEAVMITLASGVFTSG
jgi:hypothetical protein